jgi:hypothetical protein
MKSSAPRHGSLLQFVIFQENIKLLTFSTEFSTPGGKSGGKLPVPGGKHRGKGENIPSGWRWISWLFGGEARIDWGKRNVWIGRSPVFSNL